MKKNILVSASVGIVIITSLIIYNVINTAEPIFWESNAKQSYKIHYENVLKLSNEFGESRSDVIIDGTLNFRIFDETNEKIKAGFQLAPIEIYFSGRRVPGLENIYSQYFSVEMEKTGEITDYIFNNDISKQDETLIKDLLGNYVLQLDKGKRKEWKLVQKNSTGTYQAEYKIKNGKAIKRKLNYERINNSYNAGNSTIDNDNKTKVSIQKSRTVFDYDKQTSWIKSVRGIELEIFDMQYKNKATSSTKFWMKLTPIDPNSTASIWKDNFDYDKSTAEIRQNADKKEKISFWEKSNTEYLQKKYSKSDDATIFEMALKEKAISWDNKVQIRDYLRVHKDSALKIPGMIRNSNLTDDQAADLIHILEMADTPRSQEALLEILKDRGNSHMNRIRAVVALSGIDHPENSTVDSLFQIYREKDNEDAVDISNTTMLALGNISKTLDDSSATDGSQTASEIRREIKLQLDNPTNDTSTSVMLLAAENTGDKSFSKYAEKFIKSEDPNIRAAAASVYRKMDDETARNTLLPALAQEQNSSVRESIVNALREKEATTDSFAEINRLAQNESSETVRRTMVRYMVENREMAGSDDVFKKMLETETSQATRNLIYQAMYSKGKLNRPKE